jgi:inhibitor of KinA sporulation pathway (predicted exonuclease)
MSIFKDFTKALNSEKNPNNKIYWDATNAMDMYKFLHSFTQEKRPSELTDTEVIELSRKLKTYAQQFDYAEDEEKVNNWRIKSKNWQQYMKNSPREYLEEIIELFDYLIESAYGDKK